MRMLTLIKGSVLLILLVAFNCYGYHADAGSDDPYTNIGRIQLVSQQIKLLKDRLEQSEQELNQLSLLRQKEVIGSKLQKASKQLLDKAELDITVSKSNLDSIDIELADSSQTINWIEKGVQEAENQLHVLSVFGNKLANSNSGKIKSITKNLNYQRDLLDLEKKRVKYLRRLQLVAQNALQIKKENSNRLSNILKSNSMLHLKQKQMRDELLYQQQQNSWLQKVNQLNTKLSAIDPSVNKLEYSSLEHAIFYANENANYAYLQSLIARYSDQIDQMRLAMTKGISITLLNEISDQGQVLIKQTARLKDVITSRREAIKSHVDFLKPNAGRNAALTDYIFRLNALDKKYKLSADSLTKLDADIVAFRRVLDAELQKELSSRQGVPNFSAKLLIDLGKELLLVPALTFQEFKSLSFSLARGLKSTGVWGWGVFGFLQFMIIFLYAGVKSFLDRFSNKKNAWREKMNSKWVALQWLRRNFIDIVVILNITTIFAFFDVPFQYYAFIFNLAMVWLIVKSILTISRICLVETTLDAAGHDVRLYNRLKSLIFIGACITAATVFVHQLPLIYEIKALCDWAFLFLLMVVSILLLKSWRVIPHMIISHMDNRHPYLEKSIYLFGFLLPALMFVNSVIGLLGYVNLIMTVSRYEGIFLVVLVGYLVFRGLLSDGMEQLSRLMIKYVNNGWLLTEAILKPLDTVLRIGLLIAAGAVLFLFYGWDANSPIVERLNGLMHYQMAHVLNTVITPLSIIQLSVLVSLFYWIAKWTREFVYRFLEDHTKDMGVRNSIAILSQYSVVAIGIFISLRVLGVDLFALSAVAAALAFGIGFGLRDLASNFVCGFLILLERPLRVGDMVRVNDIEGEVMHIGSRAVVMRTHDHIEYLVPNSEIFNRSFSNLTSKDNVVRTKTTVQIQRHDNPHQIRALIQNVLANHDEVLKDPMPNVFLVDMNEARMSFELRYFVDLRQVVSRSRVMSDILMKVWDEFNRHNIKPPYPQHEIFVHGSNVNSHLLFQGVDDQH